MAIVNNNFYTEIANSLQNSNNKLSHRYMYGEHQSPTSPLDSVVPLYTTFWGPKVLSIVILSKNYGFPAGVLAWPQSTIDDQLDTIRTAYTNWTQYKVFFYVDFVLANKIMDATPTSDYLNQMYVVKDKIVDICAEMGDFGFEYKEDLLEGKDQTFFQPLIDKFWTK